MLVGWSLFDRDRLVQARPDLEGEIKARYLNALKSAKPWRQKLYPDFVIKRKGRFAATHTLDKYAVLAGYPDARHLKGAPAQWIRHTLRQLQATGGSYRRTTTQTKRDWHRLLDYNRRDCLALRHIVLKASREMESWRAYEQTRFCVDDGPRHVCFRAGSNRPRLRALLLRHDALQWAFVTAWNPASVVLSRTENNARQLELRGAVDTAGYAMLNGEGVGEDPKWKPEKSLLILGISRGEAVKLGRRFGQLAIVSGRRGRSAHLIPCGVTPRPAILAAERKQSV